MGLRELTGTSTMPLMIRICSYALFLSALLGQAIADPSQGELFTTTAQERWVAGAHLTLQKATPSAKADLTVRADQPKQEVQGFGGAFNELGWDALQALSSKDQETIMGDLFGPEGCRFAFGRTPVGSSDYAFAYYSYDDVKEDYAMRDFSVARDRYILIPFLKKALAFRPDLKIWASPWTPPAWMKINEHYALKAGNIDNRPGGNMMDSRHGVTGNVTAFNMQIGYLEAYALYLSKYVQEYAKEGIPLWALMPQNEIAWSPNWPCCTWRPEDLAIFVGKYLAPQFEKDKVGTEIWLGTINYPNPDYVRAFLKNEAAAKAIKGIGFQWTGSKAIGTIHQEFPQYPLMETENMCGNGENDWKALEVSWEMVVHYFHNGAGSYMYWNMILENRGMSSWGWPQNSMVSINRTKKSFRYNDEFYLMKHLSRFVQPGSRLLTVEGDEKNAIAFQTADKAISVVIYNPETTAVEKTIRSGDSTVHLSLKPKSINTLLLR